MDHALFALVLLAAIGSGIVGGIFYAFSSFVMKALGRIPPEHGVAAMNAINVAVLGIGQHNRYCKGGRVIALTMRWHHHLNTLPAAENAKQLLDPWVVFVRPR